MPELTHIEFDLLSGYDEDIVEVGTEVLGTKHEVHLPDKAKGHVPLSEKYEEVELDHIPGWEKDAEDLRKLHTEGSYEGEYGSNAAIKVIDREAVELETDNLREKFPDDLAHAIMNYWVDKKDPIVCAWFTPVKDNRGYHLKELKTYLFEAEEDPTE